MSLSLTVQSYRDQPPAEPMSIEVSEGSISIGRSSDNHWILPDPQNDLSRHHATIQCSGSRYYITDTSSNGVFILPSATPLGRNNTIELNNGDRIRIGEYQIIALIDEPLVDTQPRHQPIAQSSTPEDNPFDLFAESDYGRSGAFADNGNEQQQTGPGGADQPGGTLDLPVPKAFELPPGEDTFDFFDRSGAQEIPRQTQSDRASLLDEPFKPASGHQEEQDTEPPVRVQPPVEKPASRETGAFLPENWFDMEEEPARPAAEPPIPQDVPPLQEPDPAPEPFQAQSAASIDHFDEADRLPPAPQPPAPQPPAREVRQAPAAAQPDRQVHRDTGATDLITNFAQGAGLADDLAATLDAESFQVIGRMLRTALQGAMDVLLARTQIKSEMRLDVTTIRSSRNNPVKFSYSVDEALDKLLSKQISEGYMEPVRAIEEAFEDLRAHQIAVLAGMQSALLSILHRFDPQELEKRLQKLSPISANIPIHKQAKLWEQFHLLYEDIQKEAQDDFNRLFGHAFSEAYQEQIERLKTTGRNDTG